VVEAVTFTQITYDAFSRDAVHFRNGCQIVLQQLQEGQRLRVLNLSAGEDRRITSICWECVLSEIVALAN
jgi:hypothetical protein